MREVGRRRQRLYLRVAQGRDRAGHLDTEVGRAGGSAHPPAREAAGGGLSASATRRPPCAWRLVSDAVVIGSRRSCNSNETRERAAPAAAASDFIGGIRAALDSQRTGTMSWLETAAAADPADRPERAPHGAGGPVDQMPGVRDGALQDRPGAERQRLPGVRPPPPHRRARGSTQLPRRRGRFEIGQVLPVDALKFRTARSTPIASPRARDTGETDALVVMGGAGDEPAGGGGLLRVRLHGRLDGLGGRRALRARRRDGVEQKTPFVCFTATGGARGCRRACSA